jgi:hypothetical protein
MVFAGVALGAAARGEPEHELAGLSESLHRVPGADHREEARSGFTSVYHVEGSAHSHHTAMSARNWGIWK